MKKILNNLKIRNPETGKFESVPGVVGEHPGITYPKPNDPWQDPTTGEEQFTGDYWVDGKPIYRRTADGYVGAVDIDVDFQAIPRIGSLIKMYGYCNNNETFFPINHYWGTGWHAIAYIALGSDNLSHIFANCNPKCNIHVVVEYTKAD